MSRSAFSSSLFVAWPVVETSCGIRELKLLSRDRLPYVLLLAFLEKRFPERALGLPDCVEPLLPLCGEVGVGDHPVPQLCSSLPMTKCTSLMSGVHHFLDRGCMCFVPTRSSRKAMNRLVTSSKGTSQGSNFSFNRFLYSLSSASSPGILVFHLRVSSASSGNLGGNVPA
jgi:hypothetical protein